VLYELRLCAVTTPAQNEHGTVADGSFYICFPKVSGFQGVDIKKDGIFRSGAEQPGKWSY